MACAGLDLHSQTNTVILKSCDHCNCGHSKSAAFGIINIPGGKAITEELLMCNPTELVLAGDGISTQSSLVGLFHPVDQKRTWLL